MSRTQKKPSTSSTSLRAKHTNTEITCSFDIFHLPLREALVKIYATFELQLLSSLWGFLCLNSTDCFESDIFCYKGVMTKGHCTTKSRCCLLIVSLLVRFNNRFRKYCSTGLSWDSLSQIRWKVKNNWKHQPVVNNTAVAFFFCSAFCLSASFAAFLMCCDLNSPTPEIPKMWMFNLMSFWFWHFLFSCFFIYIIFICHPLGNWDGYWPQ